MISSSDEMARHGRVVRHTLHRVMPAFPGSIGLDRLTRACQEAVEAEGMRFDARCVGMLVSALEEVGLVRTLSLGSTALCCWTHDRLGA